MTIDFRLMEAPGYYINFGEAFCGYKYFALNIWRLNMFLATKPTRTAGGINDGWQVRIPNK